VLRTGDRGDTKNTGQQHSDQQSSVDRVLVDPFNKTELRFAELAVPQLYDVALGNHS